MEEAELKFGGTILKLKKSPTMIGVKPNRGRVRDVERAAARVGADRISQTLGGFRVVDVMGATQPMEATLDTIRENPSVTSGTHIYNTSDDGVPFVPTGELYLLFADSAGPRECQKVLDQYALEVVRTHGERAGIAADRQGGREPPQGEIDLEERSAGVGHVDRVAAR